MANPIEISLIDGISRGLVKISDGVTGLGANFVKLNAGVELFEKGLNFIGNAASGIGDLITPAADFEDALAKVQAQSGATAEELAGLKTAAEAATETTRFTALEAAEALRVMAEDGIGAKDSMEQVSTVLAFAQANAQGAAEAAAGLGGVLNGFGEPAANIGQLADSISSVARAAGTSTKALQEGLAGVGAQATAANVSIEDAAAALGVFAAAGKDGTAASALLGRLITELNDPAKKAGSAIRELGLSTGDFSGLVRTLQSDTAAAGTVLEGLSTRGRLALGILLRDGGASIDGMIDKYRNFAGASQAAADAAGNSFNGALDKLANAFTQAKTTLLEPLLKPLADELNATAKELVAFTKTVEFTELSERIKEFALIGVASLREFIKEFDFKAAIAGLNQFVADTNTQLNLLKSTFDTVKITIASLEGAFRALAIGVNAVQTAIAGIQTVSQDIFAGTSAAVAAVGNAFGANTGAIKSFSESMSDAARVSRDEAGKNVAELVGHFDELAGVTETATTGMDDVTAAAQKTAAAVEDLGKKSVISGQEIDAGLKAAIDKATSGIYLASDAANKLKVALDAAFDGKKTIADAQALRDQLAPVFQKLGLDVKLVEDALKGVSVQLSKEELGKKATEAFAGVREALDALNAGANDAQKKFNEALAGLFKGRTAEDAAILRAQVVAELTGMGASIDQVQSLMANFNAELEKASKTQALADLSKEFETLGIRSKKDLDELAKKSETAFDTIVKAVRSANGPIEDIRAAFIAFARTQLDTVKNADEFKRAQVIAALESKAAAAGLTESLVELGVVGKDASEKVAKGVQSIKPAADDAAASVQGVSSAMANAGSSASAATSAIQGNTSALITNAGAAQENAFFIGEMSDALAKQLAGAAGNVQETARLTEEIYRQRDAASDRLAQIEKEIALYDPLQKQLEAVKNKYRGIGDEQARALAAQEQRLADLRDRANGTGGGTSGGTQTNTAGGAGSPIGGRGDVIVNLSLSALDPGSLDRATLTDLARQLTGPLRSVIAASG